MSRKTFLVCFLVLGLAVSLMARPSSVKDDPLYRTLAVQEATPLISPYTPINPDRFADVPQRDNPADVAIGEDMDIGYTWYDYQHNGSIANMVRHDSQGGTHFIWMRGYHNNLVPRHVVYNYLSPQGELLVEVDNNENQVDAGTRSGYTCMSLLPFDERAVAFYHVEGYLEDDPTYVGTGQSVDWGAGMGAFQASNPVSWPGVKLIWPHGEVDRRNFSHIIASEYQSEGDDRPLWQRVGYWRGSPDDDYLNWGWNVNRNGVPVNIDTTGVISGVAAASRQSNKVALAWHHNRVGTVMQQDNGNWEEARGGWQRNNDIRYIISDDGENWAWEDGVQSMTKVLPTVPELAEINPVSAVGDTFRPYCDVDIEFDPWEGEDNLYGVFAASGFMEEPVADDDPEPVDLVYAVHGHLWFWNSVQDTLTMIYDGWYNNYFSNPAHDDHFRPGGWRLNADRGSIVFDPDNPGNIYVVWVNFPHIADARVENNAIVLDFIDGAQIQDTSSHGYLNAEVMVSASVDYGITWQEPINVTGTIWEGDRAPDAGECMSEAWASADPMVQDGEIHIFYVRDTDAGGLPQSEGVATNSPVVYHRVPIEDIPLDGEPVALPRAGFKFHNYPNYAPAISDVSRNIGVPAPAEEVGVSAVVVPTGGRAISAVFLEYFRPDIDEDILRTPMEPDGDNFVGVIPGTESGNYVWYRIHAYDIREGHSFYPNGYWYSYIVRGEGEMTIHDIQYPGPRSWGVDYSPFNGFEVTVQGIVTTPPEFSAQYEAFAIQEATDYFSGIFVRGADPGFEPGSLVEVTGIVRERDNVDPDKWAYLTYIEVESEDAIVPLGDEELVEPIYVPNLRTISSMAEMAEHLEGVLVRVWDVRFGDPLSIDSALRPLYLPITKVAVVDTENVVETSRITMHGLSQAAIRTLRLDRAEEGNRVGGDDGYITGVFCENQMYALAPMSTSALDPFAAPVDDAPLPRQVRLDPAFPNPFNGITKVGFEMNAAQDMRLAIYDVSGRLVQMVMEGRMEAGHHTVALDAGELPTGVYILRLETASVQASQKLVLVK